MKADFLSALSFLCRFGRPEIGGSEYRPGLAYYGVAGLVIGTLCTLAIVPFFLLCKLIYAENELIRPGFACFAALLWLTLELWISRGLHWDGLADLGDALGSGQEGQKFVEILKDSRLGAFGALTLFLTLFWQIFFLALLFYKGQAWDRWIFFLPALACGWSRLAPLWLAQGNRASKGSVLGNMLCAHMSSGLFRASCLEGAVCLSISWLCGMGMTGLLALIGSQICLTLYLGRVAKRNGGLSGDFFGAQVEWSQLAFLACASF